MISFRLAKIKDVQQIRALESEYYEGFMCPKNILKLWIKNNSKNFIIAEKNNKIAGFMFF